MRERRQRQSRMSLAFITCPTLTNSGGAQVIQKLIEHVPAERLRFVHAFQGHVHDLSTHPYGCRVLQRCFEHLPEEMTRPLLDELHKYASNLMQDQFGVSGDVLSYLILSDDDIELRGAICARAWAPTRPGFRHWEIAWSHVDHGPT